MEVETPPEPQTEKWVAGITGAVEATESMTDLRRATKLLWAHRHYQGVLQGCIGAFRQRAAQLEPDYHLRKIVAVDFNSVVNTGWGCSHGHPDAPETMLNNIRQDTKADTFLLFRDSEKSFKADMFPMYRSAPREKPEGFWEKFDELEQQFGVQSCEGREADDCLATVAFQCQVLGQSVTLVSKDKDLWQCLGANTSIWDFVGKKFVGAKWLKAKHRIEARQVVDWLSLVGVKNCIPGCEGIGEKTASDLLEAFESVVGAYQYRDTMTPKKREAFVEFVKEQYWDSRAMHTLSRNVSV